MTKRNEKGFSLVELLVVVIIIGIIAAIAIPSLLASRKAANEASAIASLRTIHSANVTFYAMQSPNAYGTLTNLSDTANGGLLDPTFTGGSVVKSGYTIAESITSGGPHIVQAQFRQPETGTMDMPYRKPALFTNILRQPLLVLHVPPVHLRKERATQFNSPLHIEKGDLNMKNTNEKGFSLVELLVVVIIIGIIAAIAIPSLLASRKAANEASAVNSLRTIHSAEVTYLAVYGGNTTYGALDDLSNTTTKLLDPSFAGASFTKSGYTIAASVAAGVYCASAVPVGTNGTRVFGVNERGVIYQGVGATACASGVLDTSGGTAIQ